VDHQPGRLQRRRKRSDLDVELQDGDTEQDEHEAGDEGSEKSQVGTDQYDEEYRHDQQGAGHGKLVHIGPRHPVGGETAHDGGREVQRPGHHGERDSHPQARGAAVGQGSIVVHAGTDPRQHWLLQGRPLEGAGADSGAGRGGSRSSSIRFDQLGRLHHSDGAGASG
jgi:hypothetical protein